MYKDTGQKALFKAALILFLLISIISIMSLQSRYASDWQIAVTINGEPLYVRELKIRMDKHRAEVYSYFNEKYGADTAWDWNVSHDGESPVVVLREKALEEALAIKLQQMQLRNHGLLDNISYKEFLKELKKENLRRQGAVKRNEVIYGPLKYDESAYFDYKFNNMVLRLKEKLSREELNMGERELLQYFEDYKNSRFKKTDSYKLLKIIVSEDNRNSAAKPVIEEFRARVMSGEDFSAAAASYTESNTVKVLLEEVALNSDTIAQKGRGWESMVQEAEKLEEGGISRIFEDNGSLAVIKCMERHDGGYYSFNEVKDLMVSQIIDDKYEVYVKKLVSNADIVIHHQIFNRLVPD